MASSITLPSQIAVKSCNYQSLKEEEEFLSKFKHCPYIIRCFGANEDNVLLYNLMLEYASGASLADCLRSCNSLPEIEVKNVLLGLSCIHSNGVIHCDGNILLTGTDKTAKIADFGLSMTLEQCVKDKLMFGLLAAWSMSSLWERGKSDSTSLVHKPIKKIMEGYWILTIDRSIMKKV